MMGVGFLAPGRNMMEAKTPRQAAEREVLQMK
jgi:hypothetical protein